MPKEIGKKSTHNCQYIRQVPDFIRASFETRILTQIVRLGEGKRNIKESFIDLGQSLLQSREKSEATYKKAIKVQEEFRHTCEEIGYKMMEEVTEHKKVLVLIGHPYIIYDGYFNLNLVTKLHKRGIAVIPGGMIPIKSSDAPIDFIWKNNNETANILRFIHSYNEIHENQLLPVIMTQFGCGADSMLETFIKDLLDGVPYLELEVDEHNLATGLITRCEAFWESVHVKSRVLTPNMRLISEKTNLSLHQLKKENRTVYVVEVENAE